MSNRPAADSHRTPSFITNSYQTPNEYADRFMHLLSGDEWKVLSYTVRRIFGFQKREDRISLTQYQYGKRSKQTGEMLDYGTGLSRKTIIKVLASLCNFRLMVKLATNDPRLDEGACYALQTDSSKVDVEGLNDRVRGAREVNARRSQKAREKSLEGRREDVSLSDSGVSDTPPQADVSDTPPPVSETHHPWCAGHTDDNQGKDRGKTDPPPARVRATSPRPAAGAGGGGSRFPFSDLLAWAEDKKARGEKIDSAYAVARARWRDGTADDEVAAWLDSQRSRDAATPAPSVPPELSAEELKAQIAVVTDMLRDGRELCDIGAQLGGAIRQAQWQQIASVAEAQAKLTPPRQIRRRGREAGAPSCGR